MIRAAVLLAAAAVLAAASPEPIFPTPARPVAPIVSPRWSTEDARNNAGEAHTVLAALGPLTGRTVADNRRG